MNRSVLVLVAALVFLGPWPVDAQRAAKPPVAASTAETINLNSATAAQIASLPGIGLKTAELVVQYRQKNGPFKKIEEIMNVRGIGEKSFLRIKDRLTVAAAKVEK
ncbi:MAG: helix-hairpin-helix domain-containing protein [Acidobacteria bacterium]|nr:MAG: helix-hairpin-helix domain-containing protein [Acidobacteriota bacterium]